MALGLLGYKLGMTTVFEEDGKAEPVTVIELGPCPVLQIRDMDRDGYVAVQIGFKDKKRKTAIRAEQGHVASKLTSKRKDARTKAGVQLLPKADCEPQRHVREFRVPTANVAVGQILTVKEVFAEVKAVDIVGISKGRGFQGVMKRHNFDGLPAAHGSKKNHRQGGSNSSLASNRGSGRPKRGMKKSGQYGNTRITIRNLKVIKIDAETNTLLVRGGIPGFNGAFVVVKPTNKMTSRHGKVAAAVETKTKVVLQKKGK